MVPIEIFFAITIIVVLFLFRLLWISLNSSRRNPVRRKLLKDIIKRNYVVLSVYLIVFLILTILSTSVLYLIFSAVDKEDKGFKKNPFELLEKSLPIAVTTAGFLSVIASIKIWQDTDKRQVDQAVLNLFEKLRDSRFSDIRKSAWDVKIKWEENKHDYQNKLQAKGFKTTIDQSSLNNLSDADLAQLRADMIAIRDLFQFYSGLIIYKDRPEALANCFYFYYDWWRSFLYVIAKMHDENYSKNIRLKQLQKFDHDHYLNNISYTSKLVQLDHMFGFKYVPSDEVFY